MYNRYLRNDDGVYQRVTVESPSPEPSFPHSHMPDNSPPDTGSFHPGEGQREGGRGEKRGFLSGILSKLKLDNVDTGDLLLLVILFLLFKDGEDEELLIALALLLIL